MRVLRDPLSTMVKQIFQSLQHAGINDSSFSKSEASANPNSMSTKVAAQAEEIQRLKALNERLEGRVRELGNGKVNVSTTPSVETVALQSRCEMLVKEREAVQTIMEQKIKVLVQSVAQAANAVIGGSIASTNPQSLAAQALTKDVAALQRLVNASIAALRNAANNNQSSGAAASGGSNISPATSSETSNSKSQAYYPSVSMSRSNSTSSIPPAPMQSSHSSSPLMLHATVTGSSNSYASSNPYSSSTYAVGSSSNTGTNGAGRFSHDATLGGDSRGMLTSRSGVSVAANSSSGMKMSTDSFLARSKISG